MLDGPCVGAKKKFPHKGCTIVKAGADPAATGSGEAPPAATGAGGDIGAGGDKVDDDAEAKSA